MNAFMRFSWMVLIGSILLAAGGCDCGADDDDENDDEGDDVGDDDADDDCGGVDLLPGVWSTDNVTMEIFADLTYHTVGVSQGAYDVTGAIEVEGCAASFTDLNGNGACPSEQVGVYDFVVTDTTLTTSLVSDACDGRIVGLDGTEFAREP